MPSPTVGHSGGAFHAPAASPVRSPPLPGSKISAPPTDALLAERGKTHGRFVDHARYTQQIKRIVQAAERERSERQQPSLTQPQLEALQMIAHKMGRILAGDANVVDHWDDIAGYARLVSRELTSEGN